jgi:hypothetical protein
VRGIFTGAGGTPAVSGKRAGGAGAGGAVASAAGSGGLMNPPLFAASRGCGASKYSAAAIAATASTNIETPTTPV